MGRLNVRLIAWTHFDAAAFEEETGFLADGTSGCDLCEAAGRLCYLSWNRPNPATATNAGYLDNILNQQHFSVLEHGTATFLFRKISRNVSHELIRHRHFSYSELSQRFVDPDKLGIAVHPVVRWAQPETVGLWAEDHEEAIRNYRFVIRNLEAVGLKGKKAREAARDVLPGMTETKIVVTGNYRAWRHFINKRGSEHADAAIREVALEVARILVGHAPNAFQDVEYYEVDDIRCVRTRVKDEG